MTTRESYVEHFGEDEACKVEGAALEHMNQIHDKPGSDDFRWAICICIGYQCLEVNGYRTHHRIEAPWNSIEKWIKEHGNLKDHDGDVDYMTAFTGGYNKYL